MLDDLSLKQVDEDTKTSSSRMNLTQISETSGSSSQADINPVDISNTQTNSGNSTSSSTYSDQQLERIPSIENSSNSHHLRQHFEDNRQHHHQEHLHHQPHPLNHLSFGGGSEPINHHDLNSDNNNSKYNTSSISDSHSPTSLTNNHKPGQRYQVKLETTTDNCVNMSVDSSHNNHNNMIPAAHSSDQSINYQQVPKSLPNTGTSNMTLNFRPDLFLQQSHHPGAVLHQDPSNGDHKPQIHNSFELDSGSLMQSAAVNMNMWKSTMGLNHFKHTTLHDPSFLQAPDMNSLSNWPHGGSIAHQQSTMTQHILDNPTLIGYQQHRGAISLPNQDLVGATLKNQTCAEQAFMLNSINQASIAQPTTSSNHHPTTQPHNNISLRAHQDHNAGTYNLTTSDNQFYNSSRTETRSHPSSMKPPVLTTERPAHMGIGNHSGHLTPYSHNINHVDPQPTTSSHHMASNSSSGASKNVGSFRCTHCDQVFSLRNQYQSHLKTHSQEKGSKVKFQCEICGHSFSQKTSLNRHMKSHTGERPFPCEVCGKAFSEKERLKIHMRTHTGEKPFSCGICGKSFSQKSTVKRHQTVHTGEKKFKCDCGKGFANRGNLIAHIKTRGSNHFE